MTGRPRQADPRRRVHRVEPALAGTAVSDSVSADRTRASSGELPRRRHAQRQVGGVDAHAHGPEDVAVALPQAVEDAPRQGEQDPLGRQAGPVAWGTDERLHHQARLAVLRMRPLGLGRGLAVERDCPEVPLVQVVLQVLHIGILIELSRFARLLAQDSFELPNHRRGGMLRQLLKPFDQGEAGFFDLKLALNLGLDRFDGVRLLARHPAFVEGSQGLQHLAAALEVRLRLRIADLVQGPFAGVVKQLQSDIGDLRTVLREARIVLVLLKEPVDDIERMLSVQVRRQGTHVAQVAEELVLRLALAIRKLLGQLAVRGAGQVELPFGIEFFGGFTVAILGLDEEVVGQAAAAAEDHNREERDGGHQSLVAARARLGQVAGSLHFEGRARPRGSGGGRGAVAATDRRRLPGAGGQLHRPARRARCCSAAGVRRGGGVWGAAVTGRGGGATPRAAGSGAGGEPLGVRTGGGGALRQSGAASAGLLSAAGGVASSERTTGTICPTCPVFWPGGGDGTGTP